MSPDGIPPESAFEPFPSEAVEQTIPARFEYQARRHPDRIAVHTRSRRLTYHELNARANGIARALLSARDAQAEPVAVLCGDDAVMLTTLLGVLKAGKIFVVLDPGQPDARLAAVHENAAAALVVSDSAHAQRARAIAASGAVLLDVEAADIAPGDDLALPLSGNSPATIVYTSGSTGRPKGVLQSHRFWLHHVLIHTNALRISPRDRLTLLSARSTGQAMTGTFSALLNGAALHPFDLRHEGLVALADWLIADRITIYHSSASVFRQFAESLAGGRAFPDMRVVKLGSEPVTRRDLERARAIFPRECVFVNALSSTETGTISHNLIAADAQVSGATVSVGYPAADIEVLLRDEHNDPVGAGQVGTICVRSRYLAAGYWRDPEATRAAFVDEGDGTRTFRTGDLGRLGADGALEYLGREDSRLKIRGHRVEVAEVEAVLREFAGVAQTVVTGQHDEKGGTRLVAYIVPARNAPEPATGALRAFLRARLPAHMVPAGFVIIAALPMTAAHKVDRKALPRWVPVSRGGGEARARYDLRVEQLKAIWEPLLGVPDIDPGDDFFDLGGDSLLAVEMAVRVEQAFGARVALQDFSPSLTIARLAEAVTEVGARNFASPVITLRAGGSKPPFVLAHGDFDFGGFYCRNLARLLDPERPFHALHPHGLGGTPVPETIEEMAADRLAALTEVQPRGPYLLAGFCSGGAVAVEMARQLRTRGETVERVILIDARAENAPFRAPIKVLLAVASRLRLERETQRRLVRRLRHFLTAYREESRRGATASLIFVLGKPYSVLRGVFSRPRHAPVVARGTGQSPLWTAHHEALQDYVPDPLPVPMVLLRSTHLDGKPPADEAAGWRSVARTVDVYHVPGGHETCVTRHVEVLAARINACLGSAGEPRAR